MADRLREGRQERLAPGWLAAAFVAVATGIMLSLSAALPLGEGPDEPSHVIRAAALLRGQVVGQRGTTTHPIDGAPLAGSGYKVNPSYIWVLNYRPRLAGGAIARFTQEDIRKARAIPWADQTIYADTPNTASYAPFLYLPSAAGMAVVRLTGGSAYDAVQAARLANILAYVLIGAAAILLADRGRLLLTALLVLPMSLFIGACVGQDGIIIALACLAAATLGRAQPTGRQRDVWVGAVALALVATAKPPYVPLCLAVLACGVSRGAPLLKTGLWTLAAAMPGLIWTAVAATHAVVPFWRPPYKPGPLWTGPADTVLRTTDPAAQVGILLQHPLRLVTMPVQTIVQDWDNLVMQFVGVLSWLDILLPDDSYMAWNVALVGCTVLGLAGGVWRFGWRPLVAWLLLACGVAGAVFGVYVAQYVSWSDVGADSIGGVQGRYLICMAALLTLLMPRVAPRLRVAHDVGCLLLIVLGAWGGTTSVQLVLARYYLF